MLYEVLISILIIYVVFNRLYQKRIIKNNNLHEAQYLWFPFIGHALQFYGNEEAKLKAIADLSQYGIKNGVLFSMWMGNNLFHGVTDPTSAQIVLKNHLEKGFIMKIFCDIHGTGLLSAPVALWRYRRKIISKFFSTANISLHTKSVQEQVSILSQKLDALAGTGPHKLRPYLIRQSFDVVGGAIMNHQFQTQSDPDSEVIKKFEEGLQILGHRTMSPWLYNDAVYRLTTNYKKFCTAKRLTFDIFERIINERDEKTINRKHKGLIETNGVGTSVLDMLLESRTNGKSLLKSEIFDETITLATAGSDTTAAAVGFVILLLAEHQDVQQKLYKEILDVFGDKTEDMQLNQVSRMIYLDCIVKETIRLFPPVPMILRNADVDIALPTGQILPKNSTVAIFIYGIHRNTAYWGNDAEEFKPERFLKPLKHPAQYMPFSEGSRDCIAKRFALMAIKVTIITLMEKFHFLPASDITDYTCYFSITLQHTNCFPVRWEKRQKKYS